MTPKEFELDGDTGDQCENESGGDEANDGLPGCALGDANGVQQIAKITKVRCGVFIDQADVGERPLGAALGGKFQDYAGFVVMRSGLARNRFFNDFCFTPLRIISRLSFWPLVGTTSRQGGSWRWIGPRSRGGKR